MPEAPRMRGRGDETMGVRTGRTRVVLIVLSLMVFLLSFLLGSADTLTRPEAEAIVKEFQDSMGRDPTIAQILRNNLTLCLVFFIPVFGTVSLGIVGYNTGLVLSAVATVSSAAPDALYLAIVNLSFPWTWMELAASALASSEGIMVIVALLHRRLRKEAQTLLIVLMICLVLLTLGAVIEGLVINTAMATKEIL